MNQLHERRRQAYTNCRSPENRAWNIKLFEGLAFSLQNQIPKKTERRFFKKTDPETQVQEESIGRRTRPEGVFQHFSALPQY